MGTNTRADDTVAANIAFGRAAEDIDQAAVERAAKIAELDAFVMRELPDHMIIARRDTGADRGGR